MLFKITILSLFGLTAVFCAELPIVEILSQSNEVAPDGSHFEWKYESADGTAQQASGDIVQVDKDNSVETIKGKISYTDPEGGKHEISYTAGEDGYHAEGADIPQVPEYVQKSLEYQAAHPEEPAKAKMAVAVALPEQPSKAKMAVAVALPEQPSKAKIAVPVALPEQPSKAKIAVPVAHTEQQSKAKISLAAAQPEQPSKAKVAIL